MTGYNAYRGNQVKTSTPLELVLLTYEALSTALHRASEACQKSDFSAEEVQTTIALSALSELMNGLDYDAGGELAGDLGALYSYMVQQILTAQAANDPAAYNALRKTADVLRTGWMELKVREQTATATAYSAPQQQTASIALAA